MRPICKSKIPLYNEHQYLIDHYANDLACVDASHEELHYLATVALHEAVVDYVPVKHGDLEVFASKRIREELRLYIKSLGDKRIVFDTGDEAVNAELKNLHNRYGSNNQCGFMEDMFYCTYVKM